MRIALFAGGEIGRAALDVMLQADHPPVALVVKRDESDDIRKRARRAVEQLFIVDELASREGLARFDELAIDLGILAWWNRIIREPLLGLPRLGYLNFHPSYLPYNRGKHYNFWTLVEETPFGVSIHWITAGVDDGDIAFQREIMKTWEDDGESLYRRAREEMIVLFRENFGRIQSGDIPRRPQPLGLGTFHYARELDTASRVELETPYTARSLLNLLRARTFPPHPAAWFEDGGRRYEVRVKITRIQ